MGGSSAVLARILKNALLRRIEFAFAGFALAEYGTWVAILVYAYAHGGATTAGLIAVLQLLPAAIVAPVAGRMIDRHGAARGLFLGYVVQAGAMASTAAVILSRGPPALAYAAAVVAASAITVTRPAQSALLASLVDTPDELTAATVVSAWVDSASLLLGPALAGLLIAIDGTGFVLAAFAAGLGVSALLVAPVVVRAPAPTAAARPASTADLLSGVQALVSDKPAVALIGTLAAQFVAVGALDVLAVVLAIGTLGIGASAAGYLTALFGAGAVAGAAGTLRLVGARTLLLPLVAAALLWASALALLAAFTTLAAAIPLLIIAGACRSLVDTAGRALLVRVTPMYELGRIFGLLEGVAMAGLALGSLLVPLLVAVSGVELALAATAVLLAVSVLAPLRPLRRADAAAPVTDGVRRLRAHELFAHLALPLLEELARDLVAIQVPAGRTVISEGESGDQFYLIADGEFDVSIAGEHVRALHADQGFGEIALLRDIPRTATVKARTQARLYALAREPFLRAMAPAL